MAILGTINKQPREILDFDIDYTAVLATRASSISTATSEVAPTGLTLVSTTVTTPLVRVKISGGTDATTYKITVLSDGSDGLKYEDEINVIVGEE